MAYCDRRVLSIQSHVVSGYVGNKAATFPMQVLGYEVDCINSVQLSNHTQYKHFSGQVLDAEQLKDLFAGLVNNDIHKYSHVLTGYVGSPSFLLEVVKVVEELRAKNPNIIFVCDPVMGDNGRFYVPKENLAIYRDQLLKMADIITPNQFEAEQMSGIKITNEEEGLKALKILHNFGPKTVIISSFDCGDKLETLASTMKDGKPSGFKVEISKLKSSFVGSGDLFTALILVWLHKHPGNLQLAVEKTVSTMQTVLQNTQKAAEAVADQDAKFAVARLELRLIDSIRDIQEGKVTVTATEIKF
ncbi:putative pyridoxal kinase-like [Apostichopus japonicus]|uniref:Pyridoxal kinase n=1 Tax=Stichopus japonicus TaxID=307972 RepID=A0A2G8JIJ1_STIJA|nr:putative pyridoxal kinase-like [Apostichopus japonicus]